MVVGKAKLARALLVPHVWGRTKPFLLLTVACLIVLAAVAALVVLGPAAGLPTLAEGEPTATDTPPPIATDTPAATPTPSPTATETDRKSTRLNSSH